MPTIKEQLTEAIDVVELVRATTHPDWSGLEQDKLTCPLAETRHEDGDDSSESLSINPATGAFNCYGCGWKGTSVIGYYTDTQCNGNFKQALAILFNKYVRKTLDQEAIKSQHKSLLKKKRLLQKIHATRGWNEDTIRLFRIGWDSDEKRTVIPIYNLAGFCLDVRMHDTLYRAPLVKGKRVPAKGNRDSRSGDWFPLHPRINPFHSSDIWLLEGEPDVILATQDGLNCITVTGGAGAWKGLDHDRLREFKGKDVYLCLDNDKAGQEAARILAERLSSVGVHSLKNIRLPHGKDFTDFMLKHGGSAQQLKQYATAQEYLIKPQRRAIHTVPLSETSEARFIGKPVRSRVIISGKADAPQAVPAKLKLTCRSSEYCEQCPCKDTGQSDYFVAANEPEVLDWLYARDYAKQVKSELNLSSSCKLQVDVEEWQNIEQVTLIPALSNSRSKDDGGYSVRRGYYIGHGIESNQNFDITAVPAIHPRTKDSVLLIEEAKGSYDSVRSFRLDDKEVEHLKELFCDSPKKTIQDICKMLAANHTHIYGRWDVHAAVDLAFHSPASFTFADVAVPKGSMELLLFGDTRCGKSQIVEGLISYYDLGQVVSGENASFMGLCGGAQKAGDNFQLSWGAIPINDGRLVFIDEFSGLSDDVLGRLSRVRSEGIAEINKGGINTKTRANARLVWSANPHKGREVASYANGVSAIMELVKTNEDVARFDLALVVQKGEVDIEDINKLHRGRVQSKYQQSDLRKVVLWAWSRTTDQVVFTRQATDYILKAANRLAGMYSATIPLIQGENARFKIAKLAASIAARCFSTEDGVFLRVTEVHAKLAVSLIQHYYSKPSMGYRQFSDVEIGTRTLVDIHLLDEFFDRWHQHQEITILDGMLQAEKFGKQEVQDWCDVDGMIAKKFLGIFVRCQAVRQLAHGLYIKKPAFITYLKRRKKKHG